MNGSQTEFITYFHKNSKQPNDLETVTVGSTIVRKSDHGKYLGVTFDNHVGLQTLVKKVSKIWQSV